MNQSTIKIKCTKSYTSTLKKLKKYHNELVNLEDIITLIKNSTNIGSLLMNPLSKMYNLERLKYELNDFYSFNLCKNKGSIRLIVRFIIETNEVELAYISFKHYDDFKKDKVIYYDE